MEEKNDPRFPNDYVALSTHAHLRIFQMSTSGELKEVADREMAGIKKWNAESICSGRLTLFEPKLRKVPLFFYSFVSLVVIKVYSLYSSFFVSFISKGMSQQGDFMLERMKKIFFFLFYSFSSVASFLWVQRELSGVWILLQEKKCGNPNLMSCKECLNTT